MSDAVYEAVEQAGKLPKWKLTFQPDLLRLDPPVEGAPIEVPRAERVDRVETLHGMYIRRLLTVTTGKKRRLFKLDPAGFEALQAWIGPPTMADLKKALKRRLGWVWTLGVLLILISLPMAAAGDFPAKPFDAVSCAMGAALILMGIVSRFVPNRIFFLFDCIWIGIAAYGTIERLLVALSGWDIFVLLLQISLIKGEFREFLRFGAMADDLKEGSP